MGHAPSHGAQSLVWLSCPWSRNFRRASREQHVSRARQHNSNKDMSSSHLFLEILSLIILELLSLVIDIGTGRDIDT